MGECIADQILNRYGARPFWLYGLGKSFYIVNALWHYFFSC